MGQLIGELYYGNGGPAQRSQKAKVRVQENVCGAWQQSSRILVGLPNK